MLVPLYTLRHIANPRLRARCHPAAGAVPRYPTPHSTRNWYSVHALNAAAVGDCGGHCLEVYSLPGLCNLHGGYVAEVGNATVPEGELG
ncbi:hypothetical protein PGT21_032197 [Puccinia graminis f. sp. tritici]|uniref:Uncharacterized protein n=1 Tax=Puccinia graminis f. sp. tritici TaxID=56615 RepID=A0A5B0LXY3_PUCGR|nr:hypothetical protein PGT21_032197 [Puccinia graminis f. sp. tritici]KAA1133352.1 hypothetical protein PGTUg99_027125 [Puccinia graminis f. sp. tritici]